jgi:hypothetical protein
VTLEMAAAPAGDSERDDPPRRVVYLLGAGATQGAIRYAGSAANLLMRGLAEPLRDATNKTYRDQFDGHAGLASLINDVVDTETDFEHLLTFLSDTPSGSYQAFADQLRGVFSNVLRKALEDVHEELGERRSELYAALLDMHEVVDSDEQLVGFLTLNYDTFLEHAVQHQLGCGVDYGIRVTGATQDGDRPPIPVLKLHGSFDWCHTWPIEIAAGRDAELWIPPGIRKEKSQYPFNAIWGAARDLLDCDVLRIVGCNLGPNDWDLVSLLFTTMHGRETARPYQIEVIGKPRAAKRIKHAFPYLRVCSLLQIPEIGRLFVSEVLASEPVDFADLDEPEQIEAERRANKTIDNPFERWLRMKGEQMLSDPKIVVHAGLFRQFVETSV